VASVSLKPYPGERGTGDVQCDALPQGAMTEAAKSRFDFDVNIDRLGEFGRGPKASTIGVIFLAALEFRGVG
jgi:hypothetical protein